MTIASLAPIGVSIAGQMLSQMLGQLQGAASTANSGSANQEFSVTAPTTSSPTANTTATIPAAGTLSDQVLGFLVSLQNESGAVAPTAAVSTPQSITDTFQSPLSQLFSTIDTNGDGTISQSEMESFIEGKGGTQSEADALYAGLTQNGTQSLTETQLASDLQSAGGQAMHAIFGHHHHHEGSWSAGSATASTADSTGANTSPGQSNAGGGSSVLLSLLGSLTQALPGGSSTSAAG